MRDICQGRKVFIIDQRLTTVRDADRIIVMEQGQLIEQGSHDALLKQNGYYAKLWQHQNRKPTPIKPVAKNSEPLASGGAL